LSVQQALVISPIPRRRTLSRASHMNRLGR
jgi:hypothetical protein